MNKARWLLLEKIFTVASLIHYSGAPLVVILSGGASEGGSSGGGTNYALIQLIFLIIYSITLGLLILRWKKVLPIISKGILVWLLVALAAFSYFWSDDPSLSRSRAIALFGTVSFSVYLATRYSLKEQLEILAWFCGISVVSSIIFAVILPKYGVMRGVHWGRWRGFYNHKNVLGKFMTPSVITFLLMSWHNPKMKQIFWCLSFFAMVLIIRANSTTALLNVIILVIALNLFRILRLKSEFLITSILTIAAISVNLYLIFINNADAIAALFGKDLTLTGRTDFWPLVVDKILERPWLGYGFGAFWRGYEGASDYIWYAVSFDAPNSHNGYLDLALELGLVGLCIYLIAYFIAVQKSLWYLRVIQTSDGLCPALYLLYIILANVTESSLFIQNNFFLVVQISIFLSLEIPGNWEKSSNSLTIQDSKLSLKN